MSTDKRSIDWYDQNAQNYTDHVRNPEDSVYHSLYEKPAMYALLPNIKRKSIISLGCGSGEDCNYLVQQGADQVTGIDISEKLIAIAKESYPECQFRVMDMEHLSFGDGSFDFAYSSLAIHYIEDWTKVFAETYRILKPGSYFLFSCGHPVYSAMQVTQDDELQKIRSLAKVTDRTNNKVRITGNYSSRRAMTEVGDMSVTTWHKPLGEICQEATSVGFLIADFTEPKPLSRMKEISPNDYKTLVKIPFFAIFKLYKP